MVFDSGWGGELVADFLEEEIGVVEVIRVIDWRNAPYEQKNQREICDAIEEALSGFFGKVDVFVLAGFASSRALDLIRKRRPMERFVGFRYGQFKRALKTNEGFKALILAEKSEQERPEFWRLVERLEERDIIVEIPNCEGWAKMIDDGDMKIGLIEEELGKYVDSRRLGVDAVIICNTHFWDIRQEIREVLKWPAQIIDQKWEVLHAVCRALELKGGDGRRRK